MPYFVRIGPIVENKSGVGSRGYHMFRRGCQIVTRWGAVVVSPGRRFSWSGKTVEKVYNRNSEADAKRDLVRMVEEREKEYNRLPSGSRIE